ncbi:MAG: alpha/beta hydrolase fold domain-containing protein [Candidatus Promineifilaceae bacterium]
MKIAAYLLSFLCLLLNGTLFVRLSPPYSFYMVAFQLFAVGLAPILALLGVAGALLGWYSGAPVAAAAGLLSALISIASIFLIAAPQPDFATAFGDAWEDTLTPLQKARLMQTRWRPGLPKTSDPIFEQDLVFWTIPGTDRELLCDIWQPPEDIEPSGLAFIYLHGSAWYILDKDVGTRPLFRQLTNQGHVVMDVSYRLVPEVDIYGMVGDVKRAVAWMKENAGQYGVDHGHIVLGGGSAGGHLALLAAYTAADPELTPADLQDRDLSVQGVVSFYGPTDLRATYEHLAQERFIGYPLIEIGQPGAATMKKNMPDAGRLDWLLGGHLQDIPEVYALASPVTHVSPDSPPTLLIQGEPDVIAPAAAARELEAALVEAGAPVVNIIYPLANHAFDLLFPQISPPAQSAIYTLERFLALMS